MLYFEKELSVERYYSSVNTSVNLSKVGVYLDQDFLAYLIRAE